MKNLDGRRKIDAGAGQRNWRKGGGGKSPAGFLSYRQEIGGDLPNLENATNKTSN
jgi:hypothetical protein